MRGPSKTTPNGKFCKVSDCDKLSRGATGLCKRHGGGKKCSVSGCNKSAQTFGLCKSHGGGRRCVSKNCHKQARGGSDFCIRHGGGKRCHALDCTKSARGNTDYCNRHGGAPICLDEGCHNLAISPSHYCIKHGGGHRCQVPECEKASVRPTKFCRLHGGGIPCTIPQCVNLSYWTTGLCRRHVGGWRCTFPLCTKSAASPTRYCVQHGGGKRCTFPLCTKSAQSPTDRCVQHGGGKRCVTCKLFSVRRVGFQCWTCRTGTERVKQLECMVKDVLDAHPRLQGYSYHDKVIPCGLSRKRPDFVYVLEDRLVILEVDEDAHRHYNRDCEIVRVNELVTDARGTPLVLLRFNPLQRLLGDMCSTLLRLFDHEFQGLLHVEFLGYKEEQEYDVVAEMDRLANESKEC